MSNADDGATPGPKYDDRNIHKNRQAQQTIFPPERSEGPYVLDDTLATPVAEPDDTEDALTNLLEYARAV